MSSRREFFSSPFAALSLLAQGSQARIERIEVTLVEKPLPEKLWMALRPIGGLDPKAQRVIVTVHAGGGLSGSGDARESSIATFRKGFTELLIGENPFEIRRLWEKMFAVSYTRALAERGWDRDGVIAAMAGLDAALWDLAAKARKEPVFRLWGGAARPIECYATGAYYRNGETESTLAAESEEIAQQGFTAMKIKVGGATIEKDVARVAVIRKAVGPNFRLMLDANNGWSLDQAIHASRLLEPLSITWLEEPLHWYDDVEGLRQLQTHCPIPLASGEQEQTRFSCRRLLDTGAIRFLQYDCHKYCGPTEALRVAALADAKQVLLAPHHEPQLNGHLMCSIPNGYILETFAHPRRDPFWYELYSAKPEIRRGWLHLRDAPGWGVEYEAGAIAKYGRKLV